MPQKTKPPIVTSKVPGHLNATDSAHDTKRVIKEWCLQESHTRGYSITSKHWPHIFKALRMMVNSGDYPDPLELQEALQELLRPFSYDEERWIKSGEIVFTEGDDPRKLGIYLAINPYIRPK